MKGRYNRLGYLFTHAAVVMIGIGGLLDGNLWLKMKEWRGEIVLETRDLAARDIPGQPAGARRGAGVSRQRDVARGRRGQFRVRSRARDGFCAAGTAVSPSN